MKIVLLGATGATGHLALAQALARGDEVTAYVRSPRKLDAELGTPGLRIIPGELDDVPRMTAAFKGADAVVVALGPKTVPSSYVRCTLMRDALPRVAEAMEADGVRRLVVMSGWGVGETARTAKPLTRPFFKTVLGVIYKDHEVAEEALRGRLDLTTVHAAVLSDRPADEGAKVRRMEDVGFIAGVPTISRASVATALLDAAHDPATIGDRLIVWS